MCAHLQEVQGEVVVLGPAVAKAAWAVVVVMVGVA